MPISSVKNFRRILRRLTFPKSTRAQFGDAFLEFILVTPILFLLTQGVTSLVLMLLVHQRASLVSRELGNYTLRLCSSATDAGREQCIVDTRSRIYSLYQEALRLSASDSWEVPSFTDEINPITASTNGVHTLLIQCKSFICVPGGGMPECTLKSTSCTCSCGETVGDPNSPVDDLIIIDSLDANRKFKHQERIHLWESYRALLDRNGQTVIATASGPYPIDRPLNFGKVVAHERTVY